MRQIREVLRLRYSRGLSQHAIARSLGMSQSAVSNYLAAARCAGLTWCGARPVTVDNFRTFGSCPATKRRGWCFDSCYGPFWPH
jgi:hypothetical protein